MPYHSYYINGETGKNIFHTSQLVGLNLCRFASKNNALLFMLGIKECRYRWQEQYLYTYSFTEGVLNKHN